MKSLIILIFTIAALIFTNSCNSPTENQQQFKHPKDMVWTADTLLPDPDAIQLLPENILVFAPNDIWLVCYSDVAKRLLWHYDGKTWTPIESGGGKRYTDLAGYNQYDIWLGGYSGEKAHFTHKDGNNFIRHDFDIKGQILDMTMDDKGNIWACGRNGIIMKYDKTKWIVDTLKMYFTSERDYFINSIEYFSDRINLLLTTIDQRSLIQTYYFAFGDLNKWMIADSMTFNYPNPIKWGNLGLFSINKDNYSYGLQGIWRKVNSDWIHNHNFNGEIRKMFGIKENYLFATSAFNNVLYFDGSKWENIKEVFKLQETNFVFTAGWTNGYEIILLGYTTTGYPQYTIVFLGK